MGPTLDIYKTPPEFTNEKGIKFWSDQESNKYAKKIKLDKTKVWITEHPDGHRERVIVDDGVPEYANQSWESILSHLDILALQKRFREKK